MSKCDMKNVPAAFNVLDPNELKQYEHVKSKPNASKYIKMLIQRDIDGNFPTKTICNDPVINQPNTFNNNDDSDLDDDLMNEMI